MENDQKRDEERVALTARKKGWEIRENGRKLPWGDDWTVYIGQEGDYTALNYP